MQEFEYFREIEDIQITSNKDKRHMYLSYANWMRKLVSFETDTALL